MPEDNLSSLQSAVSGGSENQRYPTAKPSHTRKGEPAPLQNEHNTRPRANRVYVFLLLSILAAQVFPQVKPWLFDKVGRKKTRTAKPSAMFSRASQRVRMVEVKGYGSTWHEADVPDGWTVAAAFYRPPTALDVKLAGRKICVLVLEKKE
ncbi:MAG: hypothetical protein ACLFUJ_07125 [Phycisphaerae bacterium]